MGNASIVLISIDTLRSDRLPAYGYSEVETPAFDALASDSILFERAYSHYPITLPSHISLFTGQLPSRHGVRDNVGYQVDGGTLPNLPQILSEAGYVTGAAVSSFVLRADTGLGDLFDFYEDDIKTRRDVPLGGLQRPGSETLERTLSWLDTVDRSRPFFLFFHIYEPHSPYTPPEPYASRYPDAYDGEVALSDAIIGDLVSGLEERGLYDDSVVVLLSDHGEGLGDHGEQEHGIFLYRESIQVPLLVKLPGGQRGGDRVSAPVQLIDVAPTLLSLLGLETPSEMVGTSLLQVGEGDAERDIYAETFYPRLHMGWSELTSLIRGDFQYIAGPDPELYDLSTDPGQQRNTLNDNRRVFSALRSALPEYEAPLEAPSAVDPETVKRLAALGYTGAPSLNDAGSLPDPKSKIHTLDALKEASAHMGGKRWAQAVPILEQLVAENPRMQDAWEKLALALNRSGRRGESVEAYKTALENSGGSDHIALSLASLLSELGRYEEAKDHAELALARSPALARQNLAEIALAVDDLEGAEREIRASVETDADRPSAQVVLAQILARRGSLDEAGQALDRARALIAESVNDPPPKFHFVAGDLLARQGQAAAALQEFEREIQLNPDNLLAYTRASVLLATQNRPRDAIGTLRRMVEENGGSPAAYAAAVETLRVLGDPGSAAQLLQVARNLHPRDPLLAEL